MEESKEWLEFERLRKKIQKKLNCGYGIVPGDSRPIGGAATPRAATGRKK